MRDRVPMQNRQPAATKHKAVAAREHSAVTCNIQKALVSTVLCLNGQMEGRLLYIVQRQDGSAQFQDTMNSKQEQN